MLKKIKEKKRSKFLPKKSSRKKESPQNCPQIDQRKGKGNQDYNVFSRVSPQKHQRKGKIDWDCNDFFLGQSPKFSSMNREMKLGMFFSLVRLQNYPQKHGRKGKGNGDSNVF